ncbi:MAG TPA: c-type cytochrome [Miltoncostaeaceae bacterium]|nr:c-type cytochrome [Miltoncostaeaceae bacterium]
MTALTLRRARRLAAVLAVGGGLALAAGCGSSNDTADLDNGKTQFANLCASCHTLAASGKPPSNVGPNLDDSFRASRQAGIDDEQFSGVVRRWITEAQKPMPRDLVTGQDAIDVAGYVASVAATGEAADESVIFKAQTTPEVPDPSRQELAPPGP